MSNDTTFHPAWWLPGPHLQTIWASFARRRPQTDVRFERLELSDGDFIDLAWSGPRHGPTVLILHGLEGCYRSPYAAGLLDAVANRGWRGVVMHFRGCSGVLNRLDRGYHSGDTGDVSTVVDVLVKRDPDLPVVAVGFSLGGNVLLKLLGSQPRDTPLRAAVAVSVPFDLAASAEKLRHGFSQLYQTRLLRALKHKMLRKFQVRPAPFMVKAMQVTRDFYEFDDLVTAPLHGFASVDDYYSRCSSGQFLPHISTPTLIVHAVDDPFTVPGIIPLTAELPDNVQLEVYPHGGHVGFIQGRIPGRAHYWLEDRIPAFLQQYLGTVEGA